jgi:ubiquinone/menaquinone biosynthesis C-methylase UbiE
MLAIARARIGCDHNLLFLLNGDAELLPFEDGQFDGVTCMRLFHRIPPTLRLQMLREMKRVARKWAILFFGMSTPWLTLRRAVRSKLLPGHLSNPYPVSPTEMRDELQAIGFTLKEYAWVLPYIAEGMVVFVSWQ